LILLKLNDFVTTLPSHNTHGPATTSHLIPNCLITPDGIHPPTDKYILTTNVAMADVDMTDAPTTSGSGPVKRAGGAKAKGVAGEGGADGKKRFEVKKVRNH
jgi:hypothetical protein